MERSAESPSPAGRGGERFTGRSVRWILERAALEQRRLDTERADSYSLAELEEMAAEARISPQALRAAIAAHSRGQTSPAAAADERPSRANAAAVKGTLAAGAGIAALFGVMIAFPGIAQLILWTAIVVAVLFLLGASPF